MKKACVAEPLTELRSPVTVIPVLAGFVAGVTATVKSVALPATTVEGFAFPVPLKFDPPLQALIGDDVFLGFGEPVLKSLLLSVSVQPLPARRAAVVFVNVVVGPPLQNTRLKSQSPRNQLRRSLDTLRSTE